GVFVNAQDNSISGSILTPVANQTGVPDISFPLAELPATKDLTTHFSLTYNPSTYRLGEYSGLIAKNWVLAGSNFGITRRAVNGIDEGLPAESENWDDIYYYTLNNEQGTFMFKKTGISPNES